MFNWLQLGQVATPSCKQSEFPAFLSLCCGRRRGEDWKWVGAGRGSANQQCWLSLQSPVLLLGFSPVEIASYVLKEARARIVTSGCIACKSKSWSLLKCQQTNDSTLVPQYHRLLQGNWKEWVKSGQIYWQLNFQDILWGGKEFEKQFK